MARFYDDDDAYRKNCFIYLYIIILSVTADMPFR